MKHTYLFTNSAGKMIKMETVEGEMPEGPGGEALKLRDKMEKVLNAPVLVWCSMNSKTK